MITGIRLRVLKLKQTETFITEISTPANIGPIILDKLVTAEFSAIAFGKSEGPQDRQNKTA